MKKIMFFLILMVCFSIVTLNLNFATTEMNFSNTDEIKNTKSFNTAINNLSNDTLVIGKENVNGSTVVDLKGDSVKLNGLENVQFENITFKNAKYFKVSDSKNVNFVNVKFEDFIQNGIYISTSSDISIIDSSFDNIGSTEIDPTWQGNGVYARDTVRLQMTNNEISRTYGHGGIFLLNSKDFIINSNKIHDTFYRGIIMYDGVFTGQIENNDIYDIGSINTTDSGVGANGIFGTGDNLYGVSVINNRIKNVLENGIEGKFGLVEGNLVDGTGIDLENHSTPSGEGIYANGLVYRNNIVKNTKKAGIKVYSSTTIKNTIIEDNQISQDSFDDKHYGIALIAETGYSNVLVKNNIVTNYRDDVMVYNNDGSVEITSNGYIALR